MEPLKVLEIDAGGGEVQIRSQSPTARADQRGYYEIRLFQQGSLRMERFAFDEATRQRRAVPCQLTRESPGTPGGRHRRDNRLTSWL